MAGVKKNTIFVAIGQILRLLMAFILLPVASRILGSEAFGRYNLATTIMFFVMLADDFGLNMWITREIAKYKDRAQRYLAYAIGLKFMLVLVSIVFVITLLSVMPYDTETRHTIWIFALYGVVISFRDLAVAVFRAFEEMVWESVVLGVERTLITLLGILVLINRGQLTGLAWVFVTSAILSLLLSSIFLSRKFVKLEVAFGLREFVPMIKGASVFGISIFLTTVYSRIDMLMLSTMKGPEIWGWYGAAHKLIDFTNVIPTVLMIATFPTFARISLSFDRQLSVLYTRGFKILFLLAIPMIPGIIFLAEPIISVYYGKEFIPAAAALELLGITAAFLFINIFTAGLYGATNNQKKLVLIQVMGLCLNAFLNFMFIPKMEHVGAALATVITEGIVLLITLMYAFSRITKLDDKKFILHALFASALMSGVLVLVHSMPLLLMVVIGIIVYFAILFFLKTITLQDFINIKKDKLNNR